MLSPTQFFGKFKRVKTVVSGPLLVLDQTTLRGCRNYHIASDVGLPEDQYVVVGDCRQLRTGGPWATVANHTGYDIPVKNISGDQIYILPAGYWTELFLIRNNTNTGRWMGLSGPSGEGRTIHRAIRDPIAFNIPVIPPPLYCTPAKYRLVACDGTETLFTNSELISRVGQVIEIGGKWYTVEKWDAMTNNATLVSVSVTGSNTAANCSAGAAQKCTYATQLGVCLSPVANEFYDLRFYTELSANNEFIYLPYVGCPTGNQDVFRLKYKVISKKAQNLHIIVTGGNSPDPAGSLRGLIAKNGVIVTPQFLYNGPHIPYDSYYEGYATVFINDRNTFDLSVNAGDVLTFYGQYKPNYGGSGPDYSMSWAEFDGEGGEGANRSGIFNHESDPCRTGKICNATITTCPDPFDAIKKQLGVVIMTATPNPLVQSVLELVSGKFPPVTLQLELKGPKDVSWTLTGNKPWIKPKKKSGKGPQIVDIQLLAVTPDPNNPYEYVADGALLLTYKGNATPVTQVIPVNRRISSPF